MFCPGKVPQARGSLFPAASGIASCALRIVADAAACVLRIIADTASCVLRIFSDAASCALRSIPAEFAAARHAGFHRDAERSCQRPVLPGDTAGSVEAVKLDRRNLQSALQIIRGIPRVRVQDQIEVGLSHPVVFIDIDACRYLPYSLRSDRSKNIEQFTFRVDRSKKAKQVDR